MTTQFRPSAPCNSDLVTGPFGVEDYALTAPLPYHSDSRCHPKYARLSSPYAHGFMGSYLQVRLRKPSMITGFVIQGRSGLGLYVKTYSVQYSDTGTKWREVKDINGNVKVFTGNKDQWGLSKSILDSPIIAYFIRVIPMTWSTYAAFRFEIIGCPILHQGNQTCWKVNNVTGIPTFDIFSTTKTNLGECGKECHGRDKCHGFTFNHDSGLCQGHSHTNYLNVTIHQVAGAWGSDYSLLFVKQEACP
ncbi:lactadherin-like [Pecten maximus]|uniref:lactadherin-like n=1 Tax=Pecten maximus TaxID=6579 RepID=UPI001458C23E|nr:lactadherin-like [Pecten maximus]